jgi:hypothetical protein
MDAWVARELSTPQQVRELDVMLTRLREGDPFALYAERRHRAQAALEGGDFSDAVVDAAIATEILLDAVLSFMLWEERAAPATTVAILGEPLATRVRTAYHPRIGGTWDVAREPVLKAWDEDVMLRRHRVVHRGIRPTEAEARKALGSAAALEEWVTDLVVAKRFTYLRTALMMVRTWVQATRALESKAAGRAPSHGRGTGRLGPRLHVLASSAASLALRLQVDPRRGDSPRGQLTCDAAPMLERIFVLADDIAASVVDAQPDRRDLAEAAEELAALVRAEALRPRAEGR